MINKKNMLYGKMIKRTLITIFTLGSVLAVNAARYNKPAEAKLEQSQTKTEAVEEVKSVDQVPECNSKYGTDSLETLKNISLYREYFKNNNYVDAIKHWRYVYLNAPCAKEQTLADGPIIYDYFIKLEKDPAKRKAYIDSALEVYDARIKYFNKEGFNLGKKGRDLLEWDSTRLDEAVALIKKSIDLEKYKTTVYTPTPYLSALRKQWANGTITKDQIVAEYLLLLDLVDYNVKNSTGKTLESWNITQQNIISLGVGIADCETFTNFFKPKVESDPTNVELLEKVSVYLKSINGCTGTDFYLFVAEKLFVQKPDAESARTLAQAFASKNQESKAVTYYNKAIELGTDATKKAEDHLELAKIAYGNKQYSQARNHANNAIGQNPNLGEAYLLIGDCYVAMASGCGDAFEIKTVYWAAVDKYQKAKSVDASVADKANSKIGTYSQYFPTKDECFFRSLNNGQSYTLKCWPNETTTVRF